MSTTICLSASKSLHGARDMLVAVAVLLGVSAFANCESGCKPAQDPTDAERNYTTEIIACAATAGFPGAYDQSSDLRCRHAVDCKYGLGPCPVVTRSVP